MAGENLQVHAYIGMKGLSKMTICSALMMRKQVLDLLSEGWGEEGPTSICSWKSLGKSLENGQSQKVFKDVLVLPAQVSVMGQRATICFPFLRDWQKVTFHVTSKVCRQLNSRKDFWCKLGRVSSGFLLVSYATSLPQWRWKHWEAIPSFFLIAQKENSNNRKPRQNISEYE